MSDFKEEAEHELISASLDVEQLDTTLFRSKSLWIPQRARGVFGGQVISQALVSATKSVDPAYALHSLHCYFLLSASASIPIIYFVERIRQGKTYTTRSVKASQSGRIVFIMICSFQKPEPLQLSHQVSLPSFVFPPENFLPEETRYEELSYNTKLDAKLRRWYGLAAQDRRGSPIESRFAGERVNEEGEFVVMWWMRVRTARGMPDKFDQPFQKCILAYMSDHNFIGTPGRALGLTRGSGPGQLGMTGSLDHTIFYYNHEFDCSDWVLYIMTTPVSGHGRGVAMGRIYSKAGALIAVTTQEGVIRVNPKNAQLKDQQDGQHQKAKL